VYYARSAETAARLGWNQLQAMSEDFGNDLQIRLFLIEQQASIARMADSSVFSAEDAGEVLVSDEFTSGGESIDLPALGDLIGAAFAGAEEDNPRVEFLQAIQADIEGDTGRALAHLERAAELLETERSSLFDIRQRGTVVENRPELVQNLGLRLIALRSYDRAFDTFESIRARGLGDLAAAYETLDFSVEERAWLAELVDLESQESAQLTALAERAVAGETEDLDRRLDALEPIRAKRRAEMENPQFPETLARLAAAPRQPVGLTELAALVGASGVPVIFYWVTASEVVVWVVSPQGMEVKSVFLPGPAVIDKSRRVTSTASSPNTPFDEEAARQLHAYLIQPFEHLLTGDEVIIVPQGPLVTLPFEALIDGRTGEYLAEQVAISYAPSAGFAARALRREPFVLPSVTAIYDKEIEDDTSEVSRLAQGLGSGVTMAATGTMSADEAIDALGGKAAVHVLLHGVFEQSDPLQSHLTLQNLDLSPEDNAITAAELLAADWRQTRLAVFSSCESAQMNVRISNEVYGLSWAPLVGGAQAVVTSRWRVLGPSNADWMDDFYGRLATGEGSPAIAAAGTMRRMIGQGEAHPYYWAGPQVFGR
jgi:CHAT domain-containing protein